MRWSAAGAGNARMSRGMDTFIVTLRPIDRMLVETPRAERQQVAMKPLLASAAAILVLFSIVLIILLLNWPFTRDAVAQGLGRVLSSTVRIQKFRSTYFPHPGCIAEDVDAIDGRGVTRMRKLTIQSSWSNLLAGRQRIDRMTAEGLYVRILPRGQSGNGSAQSGGSSNAKLVIGEIATKEAVLEVEHAGSGDQSLRFDFHELTLRNVGAGRTMAYRLALGNPEPRGEIESSG